MITMLRHAKQKRITTVALNTFLISAALAVQSCSTVEPGTGRCKAFKDPKYVASSVDTDGKKWNLIVNPDVADLKCDYSGTTPSKGEISFTAVVYDGQGFAKPALAINAGFAGSTSTQDGSGFVVDPERSDVATDSCGTAVFTVKWTCPAAKKSAGGYFYVSSGPLGSKPVKVTLEHTVQPDTVPATTTTK
ncbi:MAG: hypothetical protein ACO3A4_06745 [Silvanigrellaceae bacterium]